MSLRLLRKLVQAKSAATEIEGVVVRRRLGFELACDRVKVSLAALLNLQETGLAHDPQVFRDIVLGGVQARRNLRHVQSFLEQQPQDAQAGLLAQGLQGSDAVESLHGILTRIDDSKPAEARLSGIAVSSIARLWDVCPCGTA